jgi:hypothetical protein
MEDENSREWAEVWIWKEQMLTNLIVLLSKSLCRSSSCFMMFRPKDRSSHRHLALGTGSNVVVIGCTVGIEIS